MRQIVLPILLLFALSTSAYAQFFLGGSFDSYHYPSGVVEFKYRSFSPSLGFQYERWSVGVDVSYQKAAGRYHNFTYDETKAFTVQPFVRYNIIEKNRFAFFTDAFFSYTRYKLANHHFFGLSPGIQYDLTQRWRVEVDFGTIGYCDSFFYGYEGLICSFNACATAIFLYYRFTK